MAAPLAAQTVRGVARTADGEPVAGALVVLTDASGTERGAAVTGTTGAFVLRATGPGTWRVAVERIGYATERSEPLQLGAGQSPFLEMVLREDAVALPAIRVEAGEARCLLRPDEGEETYRLWDEARKALRISELTARKHVFVTEVVERVATPWGTTVGEANTGRLLTHGETPFRQASTDELLERGFVRDSVADDVSGRAAYGPDAELLLSDAFLDTHCFRAVPEEDGRVGLDFQPVELGRSTDIHGILWLDAETAELRSVEFGYTGLRARSDLGIGPPASGLVRFERMEDGGWIASSWSIRIPMASRRYGSRDYKLYAERSGEVVEVRDWSRPPPARPVPSVRDLLTPAGSATTDSAPAGG